MENSLLECCLFLESFVFFRRSSVLRFLLIVMTVQLPARDRGADAGQMEP
jgi:hypothetical protein